MYDHSACSLIIDDLRHGFFGLRCEGRARGYACRADRVEAKDAQGRVDRVCPAESRKRLPKSWIFFAPFRSLWVAGQATGSGLPTSRAAERPLHSAGHRAPQLWPSLGTGSARAYLPRDTCDPSTVATDNVRQCRRHARHLRNAARRIPVPAFGQFLSADLWSHDFLRHRHTAPAGRSCSPGSVQLHDGGTDLVFKELRSERTAGRLPEHDRVE